MTNVISPSEFSAFLKVQKPLSTPAAGSQYRSNVAVLLPSLVSPMRKPVKVEYLMKDLPLY